jgi:hypothetical protein
MRCGVYSLHVNFACICGSKLTTINSVKSHLRKYHKRHNDEVSTICDTRLRNLTNVDYNDEVASITVSEVVEPEVPPADINEAGAAPSISYEKLFHGLNSEEKLLIDLYLFAKKSYLTTRFYREMIDLGIVRKDVHVPKQFQDLKAQVQNIIQINTQWVQLTALTHSGEGSVGKTYTTPSMTVTNALQIWFSIPPILKAVKEHNIVNLPSNLLDLRSYDAIIETNNEDIASGEYLYDSVASGSQYLKTIKEAIPLFTDAYINANANGINTYVVTVGLYEDNFSKQLDSLISQTVYSLTLGNYILCFVVRLRHCSYL